MLRSKQLGNERRWNRFVYLGSRTGDRFIHSSRAGNRFVYPSQRARDRSYELRKGMAISEEHKKAIERGKLESDARRKQLKKQSKQNK